MDPVGFDNTEYFVDLKPKEQWRPVFHQDKDELIAAMNRQLRKNPRRALAFHPADCGRYGRGGKRRQRTACRQDLWRRSEDPGREGRRGGQSHAADPGHRRPGNASRDRPAESEPDRGPRCGGPLPDQRRGCAGCHPDRGGRQCRQPGAPGRAALRPGGAISSPLPRYQGSDRKHPPAFALRRARLAGAALQDPYGGRRLDALSRGELALRRRQVQRARPRPGRHRGGSHPQGQRSR